jgi:template-activating factor I
MPGDAGSFFNFFEHDTDPYDVRLNKPIRLLIVFTYTSRLFGQLGLHIANEIFPEAIDYFLGNAGGDDEESEEEDDSDDDAEEIDLEKPRPKKHRRT